LVSSSARTAVDLGLAQADLGLLDRLPRFAGLGLGEGQLILRLHVVEPRQHLAGLDLHALVDEDLRDRGR
jgi:hypothetical protein